MTSPTVHNAQQLTVAIAVARTPGGWLSALISSAVPGAEPYYRHYSADWHEAEEAAAFYDDVTHEIRCWTHIALAAVDDLAHNQLVLF